MGFTSSYANTILTNLFSGAYIALSTTTPTAAGGNVSEPPSAAGYERVAASEGSFSASGGKITNTKYIYYPEATASWGTPSHMCLYTGKTDGTLRYFGALTSAQPVGANTVPLFKPETISIALDAD